MVLPACDLIAALVREFLIHDEGTGNLHPRPLRWRVPEELPAYRFRSSCPLLGFIKSPGNSVGIRQIMQDDAIPLIIDRVLDLVGQLAQEGERPEDFIATDEESAPGPSEDIFRLPDHLFADAPKLITKRRLPPLFYFLLIGDLKHIAHP